MAQTAMQQLIKELERQITIETFQFWKGLKQKYIELERQQIVDANYNARAEYGIRICECNKMYELAEQYYNDNFKQD